MIIKLALKELKILLRDIHALAVLFLMPLAFIVIMSLAMPNVQNEGSGLDLSGVFLIEENSDHEYEQRLFNKLAASSDVAVSRKPLASFETIVEPMLNSGDIDFALRAIEIDLDGPLEDVSLELLLAPDVDYATSQMLQILVRRCMGEVRLFYHVKDNNLAESVEEIEQAEYEAEGILLQDKLINSYKVSKRGGEEAQIPSPVQQSVPAWLVFGMFFILIPLSASMISERVQGTLNRLVAMGVSPSQLLLGKALPYIFINQCQFLCMILAGRFLVPLLGGDTFEVNGSPWLFILLALFTSIAAVGFGTFLSVVAKTSEQATAIGGAANIILAAIGGIMIPKFLMPETMQMLANISPMAWALDGFLDIILFSAEPTRIIEPSLLLLGFGLLMLLLASFKLKRLNA